MNHPNSALLTLSLTLTLLTAPCLATEKSITCAKSDLPSGRSEMFIVAIAEGEAKLITVTRSPTGSQTTALADTLTCVQAKSDFRVINCLRKTAPGTTPETDATFTILKHTYLSAGPIKRERDEDSDVITEGFALYFRDDRSVPAREIEIARATQ